MAALLTLCCVLRFPCDDIRLSMRLLFELFTVFGVSIWIWRINKWVSAFLVLSLVSMVYPFYDRESYLAFLAIFFGIVCYGMIFELFTRETIKYLYNALCVIVLINLAYLGLQYLNIDPLFVGRDGISKNIPVALMGNRNFASALLAFGFPAFMRRGWCWFIPLIIIGLIFTKSTGGVFSVGAGLVAYIIVGGYSLWFLILPLCGGLLYCFVDVPNLKLKSDRFQAWYFALVLFKEHWLMGAGVGHWKVVGKIKLDVLQSQWWQCLHNEFLQGLFEMGIGFAVIVGGYFVDVFRKLRKDCLIPFTALIIIAVNSLVNFPFHIGTTALMAITWLAVLDVKLQKGTNDD